MRLDKTRKLDSRQINLHFYTVIWTLPERGKNGSTRDINGRPSYQNG